MACSLTYTLSFLNSGLSILTFAISVALILNNILGDHDCLSYVAVLTLICINAAPFILDDFTKKTDQVGATSIYLFSNSLWNIALLAVHRYISLVQPKEAFPTQTKKRKQRKWKYLIINAFCKI